MAGHIYGETALGTRMMRMQPISADQAQLIMKQLRSIFFSLFIGTIWLAHAGTACAQTLLEKSFTATTESEAVLDLTAAAPGASWLTKGSEAATVTILVDGRYQQDVIFFGGAKDFTYQLLLGRVSAGAHTLRVDFNRQQSAAQITSAKITGAQIKLFDRAAPEFQMLAHAPLLYARPNTIGHFSDVPLLLYGETLRAGGLTTLRYTVIISNEDGGTQTSALMARWGRTTDIEWVIETQLDATGRAIKSIYQGVNHETKPFQGRREGDHPVLIIASDNNNFDDTGQSALRFALRPVAVDLSQHSREWVMDEHPWTHRVMAEEMLREGKITAARTLGAQIADLRSYLYLDVHSLQHSGALLSFAVKLKGAPRWFTSDLGINYYKLDRSGHLRTTIRLPLDTKLDQIERISARCDLPGNPRKPEEISQAVAAVCELKAINKVFLLDENFQPGPSLNVSNSAVKLLFGEMMELPLGAIERNVKN